MSISVECVNVMARFNTVFVGSQTSTWVVLTLRHEWLLIWDHKWFFFDQNVKFFWLYTFSESVLNEFRNNILLNYFDMFANFVWEFLMRTILTNFPNSNIITGTTQIEQIFQSRCIRFPIKCWNNKFWLSCWMPIWKIVEYH